MSAAPKNDGSCQCRVVAGMILVWPLSLVAGKAAAHWLTSAACAVLTSNSCDAVGNYRCGFTFTPPRGDRFST